MAERMGFTLVVQNGAERKGYRLKPGARPIGSAAMGGMRYTGRVYIPECHFIPPATTSHHDEVQLLQVASEDTPVDAGS